MDHFDECSVLLPSATLEDFPSHAAEPDARGLLAAWSVLWHPLLIAGSQQLPSWYRADAPPTPDGPRLIIVPRLSQSILPSDFQRKCETNPDCKWVEGESRQQLAEAIGLSSQEALDQTSPLEFEGRSLAVEDFYAIGFLSLQIQIMTRRLRYTSNLDELHLQTKVLEAAEAFIARDAAKTAESLHDVFDALAEERDHYFTSDPHLIDLTLLTPSVLGKAIEGGWLEQFADEACLADEDRGKQGTPRNVLIDGNVAKAIQDAGQDPGYQKFLDLLQQPAIGWAGGGAAERDSSQPSAPAASCLDAMTMAAARADLEQGLQLASDAIKQRPTVMGRLQGVTPADLVPTLAELGYQGVIPIDFVAGVGFGDESKVIASGSGAEIEALTAKPIDAASESAFLTLGARLGEAIDSGEVATGLFVHWPQSVCDSFSDFVRAATWCVALGKFWTLPDYFTDGEKPYHHGSLATLSSGSPTVVAQSIQGSSANQSLHAAAAGFAKRVQTETQRTGRSVLSIAVPTLLDDADESLELADVACQAMKATPVEPSAATSALLFNPHAAARRDQLELGKGGPAKESYIYAASASKEHAGRCDVTVDVPAYGMSIVNATASLPRDGLLTKLKGGKPGIVRGKALQNRFLVASIDPDTGGISGVFSAARGNRLSMQLAVGGGKSKESGGGTMVASQVKVLRSTQVVGEIQSKGTLRDDDHQDVAEFELVYRLRRGSRLLEIEGSFTPLKKGAEVAAAQLWNDYVAMRVAVAGEAAVFRPLVRDKVHTSNQRKLVAPLGVLIDEAEKQTLICSGGLPMHRKVGERFLDTILGFPVADQDGASASVDFRVGLAFDAPAPIAVSRGFIAGSESIPVQLDSAKNQQAWLMHVSAPDVLVVDADVQRRRDGKLAARLLLVRSRSTTSKVNLQFAAHAMAAFVADQAGIDRDLAELPEDVTCEDGVVSLTLGAHQCTDLVVVFDV